MTSKILLLFAALFVDDHSENDLYDNMASLDATQQYLRRDCLEITGIPVIPLDNPNRLVVELSLLWILIYMNKKFRLLTASQLPRR